MDKNGKDNMAKLRIKKGAYEAWAKNFSPWWFLDSRFRISDFGFRFPGSLWLFLDSRFRINELI